MQRTLSIDEYYNGVLDGNRVILSKAITLIESSKKEDKLLSQQLIDRVIPHSGNSIRIGITGVPGVGKSTFIESFGKLILERNHKLAVLAIDPSSQKTRGSIMGDKTRMDELSTNQNAYIRPSASGSSLGGVANKTRETTLLCEAAGFDVILIETVGVGQSEVAVKNMTDFFLLLMLSGAGDELQGIKKGIMEMADLVAITKADGDNIDLARNAKNDYQNALHLFSANPNNWITKVEVCSALKNTGLDEIWETISAYKSQMTDSNFIQQNRVDQNKHWFYQLITEKINADFFQNEKVMGKLSEIQNRISTDKINLSIEMEELFALYKGD